MDRKRIKWESYLVKFDKLKYKNLEINQTLLKINKKYFRPNEVDILKGDSSKAKKILKWKPMISINSLAKEMLNSDLKKFRINEKR